MPEFREGDAENVTLPRTFGLLSGLEKGPENAPRVLGPL